jgi:formate dehydrogenase iron-sulfur subunit
VLGVRHSWFSREVVALGSYALLSSSHGLATSVDLGGEPLRDVVGVVAALFGIVGITCSGLIYVVTRRTWWQARFTLAKFAGTAAAAGPLLAVALAGSASPTARVALAVSIAALVSKLASEAMLLSARHEPASDLGRTRRLLRGPLATTTRWRFALGGIGVVGSAVALVTVAVPVLWMAVLAVVAGELIERNQFFVASVAPRMPGGFRR